MEELDEKLVPADARALQDGHALALCELEALLQTIQRTHEGLSKDLTLQPWADLWDWADNRLSLSQYSSKVATATCQVSCEASSML